jgi:hypothetical protein
MTGVLHTGLSSRIVQYRIQKAVCIAETPKTTMSTVTVSDRTGWLRSGFHRAGQRHDRTGANLRRADAAAQDDGGGVVPGTPRSDSPRKKPDYRPSPNAASGRIAFRSHFTAADSQKSDTLSDSVSSSCTSDCGAFDAQYGGMNPSTTPSAETLARESTCGLAAAAGDAADLHPSFHEINLQIARLQEQQQQQRRFFAEQLQLLHDHQQQQQTNMEQLRQLHQQQQQQQRRHQMFDTCTCQ